MIGRREFCFGTLAFVAPALTGLRSVPVLITQIKKMI
jgi:hypothetical protein